MSYKEYKNQDDLRKLQILSATILKEFDRVCHKLDIPYFIYGGTAIGAIRHKGFIPWDDDIDVAMLRKDYDRFLNEAPAIIDDTFEVISSYNTPDFPACNANLSLKGTLCVPEFFAKCPYRYAIGIGIYAFDNLIDDDKLYRRQLRRTWIWGRLAFLRATPDPYLAIDGWKRTVILFACRIAYYIMKIFHVSPQWIYKKWERAATLYNDVPCDCFADFADRNPKLWAATFDELFPTLDVEFEGFIVQIPNAYDNLLTKGYGDYMKLPPKKERKNHLPVTLDFGSY